MTIPVVWLNFNPESIARGFWDQAMLEDLFARRFWRPPAAVEFEHTVIDASALTPEAEAFTATGAVIVLPARHNYRLIAPLRRVLDALEWVLLIGTGDEEARFDYGQLDHPRMTVWAMGATPTRRLGVDRPLGSGYSPDFPTLTEGAGEPGEIDVFFCGQRTHQRRIECVAACLTDVGDSVRHVIPTARFLADGRVGGGLSREDYARRMAATKVAPAPSGPESPDSFRLYEALEVGAVPVADATTPKGAEPGYWPYVFGCSVPFPIVTEWTELPAIVEQVRADWPRDSSRIAAWYQQWKRRLAYALDDDLIELAGPIPTRDRPDDRITVVLPTCPIPSHPDTTMIEEVVESIRVQLPDAEIVIACDGIRPTMLDHADDYEEFLHRLTRLTARWHNVVPVILDEWGHQSGGTAAALELVTTPLILFAEHDTPLTGQIDWAGLCDVVESGDVNMVRLHHETEIGPDHVHMALDDAQPTMFGPVPLIRTTQWSQRPHLARADFYRERVMPLFPKTGTGTYLEWVMHGEVVHGYELVTPEEQWAKWKVAVYAPTDTPGNIQRSLHRDGRAGASTDDSVQAFKEMRDE